MLNATRKVLLLFIVLCLGIFMMVGCDPDPVDPTSYTLTMQVDGEGTVDPSEGSHAINDGTVVHLSAAPAYGYMFEKWNGDVADTESAITTVLMNTNQMVEAVFDEIVPVNGGRDLGEQTSHTVNGINFNMRLALASTFPTGIDDDGESTVDHDFWVAETQVTYALWYEVRQWALNNGYTFANAGREGSHGDTGQAPSGRKNEPVTGVSWYDSIVWCNALSEMEGLDPVYTIHEDVIKSVTGIWYADVVEEKKNGFRLPTSMEWELAARYKGGDSLYGAIEYPEGSGNYWMPGNYASGATADYNNAAATQAAAWYGAGDGSGNTTKTQDVGQKPSGGNGLGVFDMSGNVGEWCFTEKNGSYLVLRGGGWGSRAQNLRVGRVYSFPPGWHTNYIGLRFLRTHF